MSIVNAYKDWLCVRCMWDNQGTFPVHILCLYKASKGLWYMLWTHALYVGKGCPTHVNLSWQETKLWGAIYTGRVCRKQTFQYIHMSCTSCRKRVVLHMSIPHDIHYTGRVCRKYVHMSCTKERVVLHMSIVALVGNEGGSAWQVNLLLWILLLLCS